MARANPPSGSAARGMRPISTTRLIAWPCNRPEASASVKASAGMSASAVATGSRRSGEARRGIHRGLQFVQRNRLRRRERAHAQAAQGGDVAERAAGAGEVAGEAAHIDALAGLHFEHGVVRVGPADQFEPVHPGGPRLQHRRGAGAGEIIGTLAGHLDGRKDGRHLHNVAGEAGQGGADLRV